MKKPERKWMAILVLLAGMAWGAAANPLHAPLVLVDKTLISGG